MTKRHWREQFQAAMGDKPRLILGRERELGLGSGVGSGSTGSGSDRHGLGLGSADDSPQVCSVRIHALSKRRF